MSDAGSDENWFDEEDMSGSGEEDADLDNKYQDAKAAVEKGDKAEALRLFREILDQDGPTKSGGSDSNWGFKSAKWIVRIVDNKDVVESFDTFLLFLKSNRVARNQSEKAISKLLDRLAEQATEELQAQIYARTLGVLRESKNEGLWLKTSLRLAKLFFLRGEKDNLEKELPGLHAATRKSDGSEDESAHMQIYALEIQMVTQYEPQNHMRLKSLFTRACALQAPIVSMQVHGIVNECGGHLYLREQNWLEAQNSFGKAFLQYNDASLPQRVICLRYQVLANMLRPCYEFKIEDNICKRVLVPKINPFDSRETKAFYNDPAIALLKDLNEAYMQDDLSSFERLISRQCPENYQDIESDPVLKTHVPRCVHNIRVNVLLKLIAPYTRVSLAFLSKELHVSEQDVEELLVSLILDGMINGHIDQCQSVLNLASGGANKTSKYTSMGNWARRVDQLSRTVQAKI